MPIPYSVHKQYQEKRDHKRDHTVQMKLCFSVSRNSLPVVKKDVLQNVAKFTRMHLSRSLFLTKLQALNSSLKKRLLHGCFPEEFFKIFKNSFFTEHFSGRLLLSLFHLVHFSIYLMSLHLCFDCSQYDSALKLPQSFEISFLFSGLSVGCFTWRELL